MFGTETISGKTIFDRELDGEYYTPVKMRHIGVKFERLTGQQLYHVVSLINEDLNHPPLRVGHIF